MSNQINYYYVYFNVKDFSNSDSLSSFSLVNTPLVFYPDFEKSFSPLDLQNISTTLVRWDFGDGTFSNELTATHWYQWPGEYPVTLTVYDKFGNSFDSSYQPTIKIYNYINDQILFKDYRKFIYDVPASKINDPLKVNRQSSWQTYNALSAEGYTLYLYASGAAGDYQNVDNFFGDKWSHLRTLSRFYEKRPVGDVFEYAPVNKVITSNYEIYVKINDALELVRCNKEDQGSILAGTTGSVEFFYADDKVKNFTSRETPIFLYATLDNSKFKDKYSQLNNVYDYIPYPPAGYQNISQTQLPIIKVRHNPAYKLSVTTTGIDGEGALSTTRFNIPEISWENTEIPFVIKFKDIDNFTTKTYPPLSSSITNSALSSLSAYNLKFGIVTVNNNEVKPFTAVKFYDDFTSEAPQSIGGFYKGYFIPQETALNCVLTASIIIRDPPNYPKDSLFGWVALPEFNVLLRFFSILIYDNCPGYLTLTLSAQEQFFNSDNNRNVYAIQIAPSGISFEEEYNTWFADGASDKIFKFDNKGQMLSSFSLSAYPAKAEDGTIYTVNLLSPTLSSAAPCSFGLDGHNDVWVALMDSSSCIKIDRWEGYIKNVAYPSKNFFTYNLSGDYSLAFLSGFAGEQFLMPSSIDTDIDNNVWVTYTNPASNFLIKYDTNGTPLKVIPFTWMHSPVELCIDRNKAVWLTTYNLSKSAKDIDERNDYLYKFDYEGNILPGFPLSGFKLLGNITVDATQNAWVVENRDTVTRVDAVTNQKSYFIAGSGNKTNYIQSIGGVACDTYGFVWVINDLNNKIFYIDTLALSSTDVTDLDYVTLNYPPSSLENNVSAFEEKRWQAYGDWLGSRWLNKYIDTIPNYRVVSGSSNFFNIYSDKGEYSVFKVNEDFDASSFYKSLRYTENLEDKSIFFDNFLGSIVGGTSAMPYELGKTVYEKIANYVNNTSDIDLVNLDKLISFCRELSIQFEQYNYPFPPQLRRLVDLLSIKHKKLWGEKNKFNLNFNTPVNPGRNLGTQLSTLTSSISSGIPIVAFEKFSSIYKLVNTSLIYSNGSLIPFNTSIPLSTFSYDWGWSLVAPRELSGNRISDYYNFYTFIDINENSFYNNVIDWDNPYTTLSFNNSSFNEWSRDSGIVQNILSYEITKGLRLFLSGSDIVYNN